MGNVGLFALLILSIAVILLLVMKFKINAAISLLVACIIMGIGSGMELLELVDAINVGFGGFMESTGLSIGLGIIMGQLLYDYGGANSIARSVLRAFPKRKAFYALAIAAFIVSIPVFYDVTFILLAPLAIAIAREMKKPIFLGVTALTAGGVITHSCVPPTSGPLAAAGIMNVDVGLMILVGIVIGGIAMLLTVKFMLSFYFKERADGSVCHWNPATDENGEMKESSFVPPILEDETKAPGAFISMLPILTPVALLLLNTVWGLVSSEDEPAIIAFLGSKTISMLMGVFVAMIVGKNHLSWGEISESANRALISAGLVLMITGAGSAFGKVLQFSGVSDAITSGLTSMNVNAVGMCLIAYLVALVLRVAQGSATVACTTSASIMVASVTAMGFNPLFITMACCAGGMSVGHVNDSGFWIMSSNCGLSVKGGLKAITLTEFTSSLIILIECMLCSIFIH